MFSNLITKQYHKSSDVGLVVCTVIHGQKVPVVECDVNFSSKRGEYEAISLMLSPCYVITLHDYRP